MSAINAAIKKRSELIVKANIKNVIAITMSTESNATNAVMRALADEMHRAINTIMSVTTNGVKISNSTLSSVICLVIKNVARVIIVIIICHQLSLDIIVSSYLKL
ncbi:hypothetical protein HN747_05605 [archaeon]|nr:hypothetical protein [archaeon]